ELFYISDDGKVMSVPVTTNETFTAGDPRALFGASQRSFSGLTRRQYDVSSDDQRFLINVNVEEQTTLRVTLVQNWTRAIKKCPSPPEPVSGRTKSSRRSGRAGWGRCSRRATRGSTAAWRSRSSPQSLLKTHN